jgi:hypothetical protein
MFVFTRECSGPRELPDRYIIAIGRITRNRAIKTRIDRALVGSGAPGRYSFRMATYLSSTHDDSGDPIEAARLRMIARTDALHTNRTATPAATSPTTSSATASDDPIERARLAMQARSDGAAARPERVARTDFGVGRLVR